MNNNNNDSGSKTVSCKVPDWVNELINIIANARSTNPNTLLRRCIDFLIETAKVDGPIPIEMKTLINMMQMSPDWNKAFDFCSTTSQMDVAQCILILQQSDGQRPKKGFGMVMIDKPFLPDAQPTMTLCKDEILERVAQLATNDLYMEIRELGDHLGTKSIRETLSIMCDAQKLSMLEQEDIDEGPQMGTYHDFGKSIEDIKKYRRVRHFTPDSRLPQQTSISFEAEDRVISEQEASGWAGDIRQTEPPPETLPDWQPFGMEP